MEGKTKPRLGVFQQGRGFAVFITGRGHWLLSLYRIPTLDPPQSSIKGFFFPTARLFW